MVLIDEECDMAGRDKVLDAFEDALACEALVAEPGLVAFAEEAGIAPQVAHADLTISPPDSCLFDDLPGLFKELCLHRGEVSIDLCRAEVVGVSFLYAEPCEHLLWAGCTRVQNGNVLCGE